MDGTITDPKRRRCPDCEHFNPEKFKTRQRDPSGKKRDDFLFGCRKRPSGFICYWVGNISDLNIYDDMLGCFESADKQISINDITKQGGTT